jgi:hypothetical protein
VSENKPNQFATAVSSTSTSRRTLLAAEDGDSASAGARLVDLSLWHIKRADAFRVVDDSLRCLWMDLSCEGRKRREGNRRADERFAGNNRGSCEERRVPWCSELEFAEATGLADVPKNEHAGAARGSRE